MQSTEVQSATVIQVLQERIASLTMENALLQARLIEGAQADQDVPVEEPTEAKTPRRRTAE